MSRLATISSTRAIQAIFSSSKSTLLCHGTSSPRTNISARIPAFIRTLRPPRKLHQRQIRGQALCFKQEKGFRRLAKTRPWFFLWFIRCDRKSQAKRFEPHLSRGQDFRFLGGRNRVLALCHFPHRSRKRGNLPGFIGLFLSEVLLFLFGKKRRLRSPYRPRR